MAVGAAGAAVFFDAEIDGSIRCAIGNSAGDELFNQLNNIANNVPGRSRRLVGAQAIERLKILEERRLKLRGIIRKRGLCIVDATDDFILNVRDIHDVKDVITFELQIWP